MSTLAEFAARNSLGMSLARLHVIPENELNGSETDRRWALSAAWWEVTLAGHGHEVTVTHGRGPANGDTPPVLIEILSNLADIAHAVEAADDFSDWAAEWGFDPAASRSEDIYAEQQDVARKLALVCGTQAEYEALLYDTDRYTGLEAEQETGQC